MTAAVTFQTQDKPKDIALLKNNFISYTKINKIPAVAEVNYEEIEYTGKNSYFKFFGLF